MPESHAAEASKQPALERVARLQDPDGGEPAIPLQRALAPIFDHGRLDPRRLTQPAILALQRTVGNNAVNGLLGSRHIRQNAADDDVCAPAGAERQGLVGVPPVQRDAAPAKTEPQADILTKEQVRAAQAFYAGHPDRYTVGFIKQIQQVVGVSTDGIIGPKTI